MPSATLLCRPATTVCSGACTPRHVSDQTANWPSRATAATPSGSAMAPGNAAESSTQRSDHNFVLTRYYAFYDEEAIPCLISQRCHNAVEEQSKTRKTMNAKKLETLSVNVDKSGALINR